MARGSRGQWYWVATTKPPAMRTMPPDQVPVARPRRQDVEVVEDDHERPDDEQHQDERSHPLGADLDAARDRRGVAAAGASGGRPPGGGPPAPNGPCGPRSRDPACSPCAEDSHGALADRAPGPGTVGAVGARVLLVDNYDSFTYNLVQELGELGAEPVVYRNDAIDVAGHPGDRRPTAS